jgi:hypothetical protein
MAAYGLQDNDVAGAIFGTEMDIETKVVPSGVTFAFGSAVFVDAGDEEKAYVPDSTDGSLKFLGVAPISHRSYDGAEDVYVAFQDMNVLTKGQIYVTVASGLSAIANATAYVIDDLNDAQYGKFTTLNSAATYAIGGYFRSNVADGLARVELRGLN